MSGLSRVATATVAGVPLVVSSLALTATTADARRRRSPAGTPTWWPAT